MSYTKTISYSDTLEFYQYEKSPRYTPRKKRAVSVPDINAGVDLLGGTFGREDEQKASRRQANIRRAVVGFKRIVKANISESDHAILITLTFAENIAELAVARKNFNAFARDMRERFGENIRYICVAEYQKRGAIHFHTLFWGLPIEVATTERSTRLVAGIWGHGFVDIILTDNRPQLANYLTKYFVKQLSDIRFRGKKAYIASRNVIKPEIRINGGIAQYLYSDLSTLRPLHEKKYMTTYLGEGRYRLFKVIKI